MFCETVVSNVCVCACVLLGGDIKTVYCGSLKKSPRSTDSGSPLPLSCLKLPFSPLSATSKRPLHLGTHLGGVGDVFAKDGQQKLEIFLSAPLASWVFVYFIL